jgi:hypothetical protein
MLCGNTSFVLLLLLLHDSVANQQDHPVTDAL